MPDTTPIPTQDPELTSTIPLQGMPESDTNVYATPPATIQPATPQLTQTIPSETAPNNPDMERQYHEDLLHRILRVTRDTLAPQTTATVHMDKDGNVHLQQDPASPSEKWHSIAAAALGGLASGLQNAQGPGGFGRAIAAGTQYGLGLPAQRQQQAQQEANTQSELQMRNAQHALLDQQIVKQAFDNKNAPLLAAREYSQWRLDMATKLDAVGADFVGSTPDMEGIANLAKRDPTLIDAHTGKINDRVMPVPEKDGSISWYRIPADTANQKYMQPWTYDQLSLDENGEIVHNKFTAPAGRDTVSQHLVNEKSLLTQNGEVIKQHIDAAAKLGETNLSGDPTVTMAHADAERRRGNTALADQLDALAQRQLAAKKQLKPSTQLSIGSPQSLDSWANLLSNPGSGVTLASVPSKERDAVVSYMQSKGMPISNTGYTPPAEGSEGAAQVQATTKTGAAVAGKMFGGGDPNSAFEMTSKMLHDGDILLSDIPARVPAGQPKRADYIARAVQLGQDAGDNSFSPEIIKQEAKFAENPKTQAVLDGIERIIGSGHNRGQFDQMINLAKAANLGPYAPINSLTLAGKTWMGQPAAKNFETSVTDTRRAIAGLMGNPMLGGGETDKKLQQADEMLGQNPTLDNLISARKILTDSLKMQRNSLIGNNRFLQRRYAGTMPAAPPAPAPAATPTQNTAAATQPAPSAPQRPANVPANYEYRNGPHGIGWYKPQPPQVNQ